MDTNPADSTQLSDAITAVAAFYEAEKNDAAGIFNVALTLMGIAAAYLAGCVAASGKFGTGVKWPIVPWVPFPLWLIAGYQSLLALNAMSHGISVQVLEDALFEKAGIIAPRDVVGSVAGDKIMDVSKSRWSHKLVTFTIYMGIAALTLGFTVFAVVQAWTHVSIFNAVGASILYTAFVLLVVWSWLDGFSVLRAARGSVARMSRVNEQTQVGQV